MDLNVRDIHKLFRKEGKNVKEQVLMTSSWYSDKLILRFVVKNNRRILENCDSPVKNSWNAV